MGTSTIEDQKSRYWDGDKVRYYMYRNNQWDQQSSRRNKWKEIRSKEIKASKEAKKSIYEKIKCDERIEYEKNISTRVTVIYYSSSSLLWTKGWRDPFNLYLCFCLLFRMLYVSFISFQTSIMPSITMLCLHSEVVRIKPWFVLELEKGRNNETATRRKIDDTTTRGEE